MRWTIRFGIGSATPPIDARRAVAGSAASHTVTGNADAFEFSGADAVARLATVAAAKRTAIGTARPSTTITGHAAAVTTRAIAPPSPMTT